MLDTAMRTMLEEAGGEQVDGSSDFFKRLRNHLRLMSKQAKIKVKIVRADKL